METYNGFIVGKKYKKINCGTICYFCGLDYRNIPVFEIVEGENGINLNKNQVTWASKGTNRYWCYLGLDTEFSPIVVEDETVWKVNGNDYVLGKYYFYDNIVIIKVITEPGYKNNQPSLDTSRLTFEYYDWSFNLKIVREATLEEIEWLDACITANKFVPKPEKSTELTSLPEKSTELTSLPEKWYIKPNKDNWEDIFRWAGFSWEWTTSAKYVSYRKTHNTNNIFTDGIYTEITFEQFKKWILHKKDEEYVPQVGDWVVILRDNLDKLNGKSIVGKLESLSSFKVYFDTDNYPCYQDLVSEHCDFPKGCYYACCYKDRNISKPAIRKALPHEIRKALEESMYIDYDPFIYPLAEKDCFKPKTKLISESVNRVESVQIKLIKPKSKLLF